MNDSRNSAKRRWLPLAAKRLLKEEILGPDYDLSLAWITSGRMREINRAYRGKDKPTNILSFPFDPKSGEILFCAELIKPAEVVPLFIHGLLHLKGLRHGSKMTNEEGRYLAFFTSHATHHRRRSGHWNRHHPLGGRGE